MKRIVSAVAVLGLSASTTFAGGLAQPLVDPEVIGPEPVMSPDEIVAGSTTSGGFIVPLVILAALVAIASASSGGGGTAAPPPPIVK